MWVSNQITLPLSTNTHCRIFWRLCRTHFWFSSFSFESNYRTIPMTRTTTWATITTNIHQYQHQHHSTGKCVMNIAFSKSIPIKVTKKRSDHSTLNFVACSWFLFNFRVDSVFNKWRLQHRFEITMIAKWKSMAHYTTKYGISSSFVIEIQYFVHSMFFDKTNV